MLFRYNKFHEGVFMSTAGEVTGWMDARYDRIAAYFSLKKANETLVQQNERLLNLQKMNFLYRDTSSQIRQDSILVDSVEVNRQYRWRAAKVVGNTISLPNNFITLQRGEAMGVRKDMGVVGPNGIVGTVVSTSKNYSVVMSLLHRQSRTSAKLKKTGDLGTVLWDGESPFYLTMTNVPKSVQVKAGDTVVTSQYSYLFPHSILVGMVVEVINDPSSNFYTLRLSTATDFFKLENVYLVENLQKDEQRQLEESIKSNQ